MCALGVWEGYELVFVTKEGVTGGGYIRCVRNVHISKKRGESSGMVDGVFGCVFLWGILRRHGDDGVGVGGEDGG